MVSHAAAWYWSTDLRLQIPGLMYSGEGSQLSVPENESSDSEELSLLSPAQTASSPYSPVLD